VTARYADLLARHRADVGDAMFSAVRALRWSADRLAAERQRGADIAVVTKGNGDVEGLRRRVVALMAGSGLPDPQVTICAVDVLDRLWSGKVRKFQPLDSVASGRRG
jgi:hypothetical protein